MMVKTLIQLLHTRAWQNTFYMEDITNYLRFPKMTTKNFKKKRENLSNEVVQFVKIISSNFLVVGTSKSVTHGPARNTKTT